MISSYDDEVVIPSEARDLDAGTAEILRLRLRMTAHESNDGRA
jgi:hypothetical protein